MRFWSIHPAYLDTKALGGCWREGLGALVALRGDKKGYVLHSGLTRWKNVRDSVYAFSVYMHGIWEHATQVRHYKYDRSKLVDLLLEPPPYPQSFMPVTEGQIEYELQWLRTKLDERDPERAKQLPTNAISAELHPVFRLVPGPEESWERKKL